MYVIIRGGLGNQMFQYAHAVALAAHYGVEFKLIDGTNQSRLKRTWGLDCFGVEPDISNTFLVATAMAFDSLARRSLRLSIGEWLGVLVENEGEVLGCSAGVPSLVSGYWQGERFFSKYENMIRSVFTFPEAGGGVSSSENNKVVAIHFRRGDYVDDPLARMKHLTCDPSWYRDAWSMVREFVPGASAVVFSDDPSAARKLLELDGDVHYVETAPDAPAWKDLAAMSRCGHLIISNSTYSWWAAYLCSNPSKIVIAPKWWFRGVSTESLGLCPNGWHLL